jgi:hypothetical protein
MKDGILSEAEFQTMDFRPLQTASQPTPPPVFIPFRDASHLWRYMA